MTFRDPYPVELDARELMRRRPLRPVERALMRVTCWVLTGAVMAFAAPTVAVLVVAIGAGGAAASLTRMSTVVGRA